MTILMNKKFWNELPGKIYFFRVISLIPSTLVFKWKIDFFLCQHETLYEFSVGYEPLGDIGYVCKLYLWVLMQKVRWTQLSSSFDNILTRLPSVFKSNSDISKYVPNPFMCFVKTQTEIVHKDGKSMEVIYDEHLHRSEPWNKLGIGPWNKTEYICGYTY